MNMWAEELLAKLGAAQDASEMLDVIGRSARILGFEQCANGYRQALPFTNPKTVLVNNYHPLWRQRYAQADYLSVDPTVRHARRSHQPLVWSDELFSGAPQLWEEAQSFGLGVGWAQSCFDRAGSVGLLSLARSHEQLTPAEIIAKEPQMRWLVNIAHAALSAALKTGQRGDNVNLTAREVEVLQWTADGKSCAQVSAILGISVNTVKFHTKNAILKLHAANKTAAVARAAGLGLLDF